MDMQTTSAATLPADWAQPTGCLAKGDFWNWEWNHTTWSSAGGWGGGANLVEMLGAPTDLSCYPPSYTPSGTMYGSECPDGFTSACNSGGATTCCPTAYDFQCHSGLISTYATVSCSSNFQNTTVVITPAYLTTTLDGSPVSTGTADNFTLISGTDVLFAMGVAFANPAQSTSMPSSSTLGTTSSTPTVTSTRGTLSSTGSGPSSTTSAGTNLSRGIGAIVALVVGLAVITG
ncbi:hypothetical protein BX600DRAFT_249846 [Xylariales sp. PMI_506]|nr:hypothetical protein BX600DRAFT_249846 [Xylariales sp. PMI_506]